MTYKISVNENFQFDLSEEQATSLDTVQSQNNDLHVLQANTPFKAEVVTANFNQRQYTVKVNNTIFDVSIQNETDLLISKMGFESGANKKIDAIKAPMPGLILQISVKVGQTVAKNDPMIILSAMKMENSFLSPRDGKIKAVHASVGDAVDKGQLLIEFES